MFRNVQFIKPAIEFEKQYTGRNHAPMFRKRFVLEDIGDAKLYVCGLGYGYYYINGRPVSEDLLTAPVSNYNKTLWVNVYDVTEFLQVGENCIAVWCGNGWFNEEFPTSWEYDKATWRDLPKFILKLEMDGETIIKSDTSWKCLADSAVWFNALRSGEYFDARKYDADWNNVTYNDSGWDFAAADDTPPTGEFRICECEPIRETTIYECRKVIKTGDQKFVFDFGQNMSGYIRLKAKGKAGQELVIRYAEQLQEDGSLELNHMDIHYPASPVQTDRFICSGEEMIWSPKFVYHGFRYVEIEGLEDADQITAQGVFVHQDVDLRTEFECSEQYLNQLFRAGIMSTYSNMFYQITDCPTREKMGWANDAQASAEQILTNFRAEKVLEKWLQDIRDSMREDGALPGVIPTSGWGYEWVNGPVSDGVLFEIPYRIYLHTGDKKPLIDSKECFDRYLNYLDTRRNEKGFVSFGLLDWACPGLEPVEVPAELINGVLEYFFCKVASLAAGFMGVSGEIYDRKMSAMKERIMDTYLTEGGECTVNHQTAAALMIYYDMYQDLEPLKQQLKNLIEEAGFHHNCGMVGLRRLYMALNKCSLQEYAYRIITAKGYPGYRAWLDLDATTLWEYWDYQLKDDSKNHQMYSDVLSWMVKTILGIQQAEDSAGFKIVRIMPYFFEELNYVRGSCNTYGGKVSVSWKKEAGGIEIIIEVPEGMTVLYEEQRLHAGRYRFDKKCSLCYNQKS